MPVHKPKSCRERVNRLICQRIMQAFPQIGQFFVKIAGNMLGCLNNLVPIPHCGNALGIINKNNWISRFCLARARIYTPLQGIYILLSPLLQGAPGPLRLGLRGRALAP